MSEKFGPMTPGVIIYTGNDKKALKRINLLIKDIERNGFVDGIGKPEELTGELQGEYSRRIDEKNRLVYHMEQGRIYILQCRGHYNDNDK